MVKQRGTEPDLQLNYGSEDFCGPLLNVYDRSCLSVDGQAGGTESTVDFHVFTECRRLAVVSLCFNWSF